MSERIIDDIVYYPPFDEQEEKDKVAFLKFLHSFDDVLTRENIFGHMTASACVIDEDLSKILLVHHNTYNGLLFPGGHADGEDDLLSVATREVYEETGINVEALNDGEIFTIQALPTKGHFKHGKYVSAHTHYDVAYLLMAAKEDVDKIRTLESENSLVKWAPVETILEENLVDWFRPIEAKMIKKLKAQGYIKR